MKSFSVYQITKNKLKHIRRIQDGARSARSKQNGARSVTNESDFYFDL